MVQYGRPSGSSWTKFSRTPTCRSLVGKTIRWSSIGTWMGKWTELGLLLCSSKTRIILFGKRGWHQHGWKEPEYGSHVEEDYEKCGYWRTTSFLDNENWGCTQRECKQNEVRKKEDREMFETRICAGTTEKLPGWEISTRKDSVVVLRHGRTCSKMRWEMLRIGEQKDRAVTQSLKSLLGWPPFQERGTWISGRIIASMLTNCLEMLVLCTNWWTWHSLVSKRTCTSCHKMDRSLWPTLSSSDFIHSSHKWLPTILSCG